MLCASLARWTDQFREHQPCPQPSSLSFFFPAGQRHVSHPSRQKPDERGGPHRKSFLRGFDQIPEGLRHRSGQLPGRILEDEGTRKETASQARKAGGISDTGAKRLSKETHFSSTGSKWIQSDGFLLIHSASPRGVFYVLPCFCMHTCRLVCVWHGGTKIMKQCRFACNLRLY